MRRTSTRLITGVAVAIGLSAIVVSAIGGAVARSPVEQGDIIRREALTNRYEAPASETDFQLDDHQQLRRYFLK